MNNITNNRISSEHEIHNRAEYLVMPKEVSAFNTYWLLEYLAAKHPEIDPQQLLDQISQSFPCYVENLQNGDIEQVSVAHLQKPRYWFSHQFVKALHDLIQEQIPDPKLGYKIGRTIYKTQPIIHTALGIPLLGINRVAAKVSKEAAKFNRTKQYQVVQQGKGFVKIRIVHNPGITCCEFTIQWNAGCFASYARLAGATDIEVELFCIHPGPNDPADKQQAVWEVAIRYKEPGLVTRLAKAAVFHLPWVKTLTERAEAIEDEHQEQILDRDNIIRQRTSELTSANNRMLIEIAERKKAEEALQKSKQQLQRYIAAIDEIGLGLATIDRDCRLFFLNKTMHGWFGGNDSDSCHGAIMGLSSPCPDCRLNDVIVDGANVHYQPIVANGRTFEIVATPVNNTGEKTSKLIIVRDITAQIQQEQRRSQLERQREQIKKLDSLKTMAEAIAHRFNNAMQGVQGNLQLLALQLENGSEEHEIASQAYKAARGASQVGSIMMSYVGQKPLALSKICLVEIVKKTVAASKHLCQPTIEVKLDQPSTPLYCSMDPLQIKEALESLLANASESLNDGSGTIEISFGTEYFTTDCFPLSFQDNKLQDGFYSFCQIRDSGHGVSLEHLPKVFDPFFSTRFVGRGLGLALTQGIMQTHKGAVTIESSPDNGTTVRMLLPAWRDE